MKLPNHFLAWVSLVFGVLGSLLCLGVVVVALVVGGKFSSATEEAFATIDETLFGVDERITETSDKVEAMKITAEGLETGLKNFTKDKAAQMADSKFGLQEKSTKLSTGLETVDGWLETAERSTKLANRALKVSGSMGAETNPERAEKLAEEIGSLRSHISSAATVLESFEELVSSDGEITEERSGRLISMVTKVTVTLTDADERIDKLHERVAELRTKCGEVEGKTLSLIRLVMWGVVLLAVWMLAGQISLIRAAFVPRERGVPSEK